MNVSNTFKKSLQNNCYAILKLESTIYKTMTDRTLQHRRVHNLLLIQKLLSVRGDSSPFTLVLDTIEQTAKPLISHYIHNAKVGCSGFRMLSSSLSKFYFSPRPQKQTSYLSPLKHPNLLYISPHLSKLDEKTSQLFKKKY